MPAYTPGASWNTSLIATPRATSSCRAASMSETIKYMPCAEPGAAGVIALPGSADLLNPKVLRGSMGAAFKLPNFHATDGEFVEWVTSVKATVWSTAMEGLDIRKASRPTGPLALLLGNEGAGVRPELAAKASASVSIPIAAGAESLNVAAAAAILLWECSRAG